MPDMRFAPAPVILAKARGAGLNQTNLRSHNECLVLDLLRREGTLSRFEIGQRTGLSAQTVSVLVRSLLGEGLLLEQKTSRGRIGPPTTPFSLNPDGAFALGVYAGIRVIDLCVLDFRGTLRAVRRVHVDAEAGLSAQIVALARAVLDDQPAPLRDRCLGVGLGVNQAHWAQKADAGVDGWSPETGLQDVEDKLTATTGLTCYILDDTVSAATGQVLYGEAQSGLSFLYVHVGAETSARVVLNGQAQVGYRNAPASMPGLSALEQRLAEAGSHGVDVWMGDPIPERDAPAFADWTREVADRVATMAMGLLPFLNISQVILVTAFTGADAEAIAGEVRKAIHARGADVGTTIGHNSDWAKASGAAARVLSQRFTLDTGGILPEQVRVAQAGRLDPGA